MHETSWVGVESPGYETFVIQKRYINHKWHVIDVRVIQVKSGMEGKPGQNVQKMLNSSSCTLVFASMCSARWVYSISRR